MINLLPKLFKIIEKSGDKFIFADLNSGGTFVIMRLQEYEALLGNQMNNPKISQESDLLTKEKRIDTINRDIAFLKEIQQEPCAEEVVQILPPKETQKSKSDDQYFFEPIA